MLTTVIAGRVFDFSHAVGRGAISGMGFRLAVALALGEGDTVYVANRGWEQVTNVPWNKTQLGTRIGKLTIGPVPGDEEVVCDFSRPGDGPGEIIWPAGIVVDSQENVYVTDEWLNRVSIFDKDGNFLRLWGTAGSGAGEFYGPSGIAIDQQDTLYIVDSRNHRVQKFTPHGEFVMQFGRYGTGKGQLNRPTDVAVDPDGDVYVCDWANHRVQVFGPEGKAVTSLLGDAQELSKWAKMTLAASPDAMKRRREVHSLEREWRFAFPTAVVFDAEHGRVIVSDTQRNRLQIYNKSKNYTTAARTI
jgi:DNA-binding beta-propeller fold protein YncE